MSKFERYWMNCVIWLLLAGTFGDSTFDHVAKMACYFATTCYLIGMVRASFSGEKS